MSLSGQEKRVLNSIDCHLSGSDPGLTELMDSFTRLMSGEAMPIREQTTARWELAAHASSRSHAPRTEGITRTTVLMTLAAILTLIGMAVATSLGGSGGGAVGCQGPWTIGCSQSASAPRSLGPG